jgi:hypothetical protein
MNRNSLEKTRYFTAGSSEIDCITRIITEQWPEIRQAAVDREIAELEQRRVLILAARNQLRQKAS